MTDTPTPVPAASERMTAEHVVSRMQQRLKATTYYDDNRQERHDSTFVVEVEDVRFLLALVDKQSEALAKAQGRFDYLVARNGEDALKRFDHLATLHDRIRTLSARAGAAERELAAMTARVGQAPENDTVRAAYADGYDAGIAYANARAEAAEARADTARAEVLELKNEVHGLKGAPDPRAFDLNTWADWERLLREVQGYMHVCWRQHDGGDRKGRNFAQDALKEMASRIARYRALLTAPPPTAKEG